MAQVYTFSSGSPIPGGRETNFDAGSRGVGAERHYKGGKMKNWIIDQVNSRQFPGLEWVDEKQSKFKVPWRHAKKKGYNRERDAALFKEWAMFTGKYAKHSDPTIWKINFRCALNSLKDINECKEEHTDSFKVYQILPFPHNRKKVQKKDPAHTVSKHESLVNFNFSRQPIMPQNPYLDYTSKFQQQALPDLEIGVREIDIAHIKGQPQSNFSADSPYSDQLMDRPSPYSSSYPLSNLSHEGMYPDIVITKPENVDPNAMLESNLFSNISEPGMGTNYGPSGTNMSDNSIAEAYPYYNMNRPSDESLLGLPGLMHLPVSRSKSMEELNSLNSNLLAFNNFDSNIYKWRSTGNLGVQAPWEMYYANSLGSMSSLSPEDYLRFFKAEYLSDSGESNSDYAQSGNNSYPSSNITLPPHMPGEIPLHSSISIDSETDNPNLYIDVGHMTSDSKFAQEL